MKILYGIQLNGNGHITRSLELINKLKQNGHLVDVITSGGNSSLKIPVEVIKSFQGFSMYFNKSGKINWLKTTKSSNLFKIIKDTNFNCSNYDLVISDFEPISAYSAKKYNIKSIGISNQASLMNVKKINFYFSLKFIKHFAPCDTYIPLEYIGDYQPIISEDLLNSEVSDNDFYLVYLSSYSLEYIKSELENSDKKFKVYSSEILKDNVINNIEFKKPNRESFKSDLLNCSGVITASGFSTTSESLVLGKKLWSIPVKGQFEQIENAKRLKDMNIYTDELTLKNLNIWLNNYQKIEYNWTNPIKNIIDKINGNY
jgi:uncharacterized protein (TIGR00661 family)